MFLPSVNPQILLDKVENVFQIKRSTERKEAFEVQPLFLLPGQCRQFLQE
jgi:hypothetical protein